MSADSMTLVALQHRTGMELRYFELVEVRFSGQKVRCYLAVGRHALYLVQRNLAELLPGGEIYYAHIVRVVEDTKSTSDMLVVLSDNRPKEWVSTNLFIIAENRKRLVNYIQVAWQTDYAWRLNTVELLPVGEMPLRKDADTALRVLPWRDHQALEIDGFSIFVRKAYRPMPGAVSSRSDGAFYDPSRGTSIIVDLHEPVAIRTLEEQDREHIRWFMMDYKQNFMRSHKQAYVVHNAFYLKKMNLTNDMACWSGWELFIKTIDGAFATILLRRHFAPPLMNEAQDFAVTLKCPMNLISENKISDNELLLELRLIADTLSPVTMDCTAYPPIYVDSVQAKLDALLLNEDGYRWIGSTLDMKPCYIKEAEEFMQSILKLLQDENALASPDILSVFGDVPQTQEPMSVPHRLLQQAAREQAWAGDEAALHAWYTRLARFFAWCVDGGLLGRRFTFCDLVAEEANFTKEAGKKVQSIIQFLLHIRLRDLSKPYAEISFFNVLHLPAGEITFNDRMMQILLELGYVKKAFTSEPTGDGSSTSDDLAYSKFLGVLLSTSASSMSLKASICRLIIASREGSLHPSVLVPVLIDIMRGRCIYLSTYATVTLVNLSRKNQYVKNMVMAPSMGIVPICTEQLRSKDNELIYYTLALLTNLTKSVHHRDSLTSHGILEEVVQLLQKSYSNPFKRDILPELVSVLGQLCNDEETRARIHCDPQYEKVVDWIIYIFHVSEVGSKVKSKTMFTLKQISIKSSHTTDVEQVQSKDLDKLRADIGKNVIETLLKDLKAVMTEPEADAVESARRGGGAKVSQSDFWTQGRKEYATNGVLLLLTLAILKDNAKLMEQHGIQDIIDLLRGSPVGKMDSTRDRLDQLAQRVYHSLDDSTPGAKVVPKARGG